MRRKAKTYTMIFVALLSFFALAIVSCENGDPENGCGRDTGTARTPNLVNMDESEAKNAIIEAGLTVGTISTECSDTVSAGEVGRQEPAASRRVEPGNAVNIFISDGLLCNVRIPDTVLRQWITDELDIGIAAPISESALKSLTRLWASGYYTQRWGWKGVVNLEGIQYCSNLTYLEIGENSITDISLLSGLTNLRELYLTGNPISNIDALSGLTNLRFLHLGGLPITNLDALSGLTNLYSLDLQYSSIVDTDGLSGLSNLEKIYLYNTSNPNLDGLSGLTNLKEITLNDAQLSNIDAFSLGFPSLSFLNLENNAIENLTPLVENANICVPGKNLSISLENNPLNSESCNILIPKLMSRGDCVIHHSCDTEQN